MQTFRANSRSSNQLLAVDSLILSIPSWINELRRSNESLFPKHAVGSLNNIFAFAYKATIDLIREEVARYQMNPDSWSGNGAYLGLVLTATNQMPLPTDLLETILRLPQKDREVLFGDQSGLITQTVGTTALSNYDFVEQWIWDANRGNADRYEMVSFYLYAYENRVLDGKTIINKLATGLRRALFEESVLVPSYAEILSLLSPKEHSELLEEAFSRDDVDWIVPVEDLRRMLHDREFANECFSKQSLGFYSVKKTLTDSAMFNRELFETERKSIQRSFLNRSQESTQPQVDVSRPLLFVMRCAYHAMIHAPAEAERSTKSVACIKPAE